jgi:hypothetical protein
VTFRWIIFGALALGCSGSGGSGGGGFDGGAAAGGFGGFGAAGSGGLAGSGAVAGSAGSSGGGGTTSPQCDVGQLLCGELCATVASDPLHCGGCDVACAEGQVCENAACKTIADCTATPCSGLSYCDLASKKCKPGCAFNEQCGNNEVCDTIAHSCECLPGFHRCGGVCLPETSTSACGASCTVCPTDANGTASCQGGSCKLACNSGFHDCGGQCKPNDSTASCGSSCTPCAASANGKATCTAGQCGVSCNPGYHACGSQCLSDQSPASCGSSCTPCPTKPGATASCVAGQCSYACSGGVTFEAALKIKSNTYGLALGDVTGDGKLDIVTVGDSSVYVHPGNANGTFQTGVSYPLTKGTGVAVGDINGDGRLDVVAGTGVSTSLAYTRALWKLLGQSNGTLSSPTVITNTQFPPGQILLSDFSGDGKLDYAYVHAGGGNLHHALGNGDGTFAASKSASEMFEAMALADATGDGKLDIVGASYDKLTTLPRSGTTSMFFGASTIAISPSNERLLGTGDLNGDGRDDVVLGTASDGLSVHLAQNGGVYAAASTLTGSEGRPVVADFNADGKADVAQADYSYDYLRIGSGNGSLGGASKIYSGGSPTHALAADLNGDGFADLVYTSKSTWNSDVYVRLSKCQ